ncbi:MAG: chalcone isomerase family protein [Planctomycetota bacterium]
MLFRPVVARFCFSLVALCLAGSTLVANPKGKRDFPLTRKVGEKPLRLNGKGLCEWGFFGIDLYWGALYLESKTTKSSDVLKVERSKRIELLFLRALTKDQMRQAFSAAFEANAGKDLKKHRKDIDAFLRLHRSVKVGERWSYSYVPKVGLDVFAGKKKLFRFTDESFCKLFFKLYVGPKPPTKALRSGLLGKR